MEFLLPNTLCFSYAKEDTGLATEITKEISEKGIRIRNGSEGFAFLCLATEPYFSYSRCSKELFSANQKMPGRCIAIVMGEIDPTRIRYKKAYQEMEGFRRIPFVDVKTLADELMGIDDVLYCALDDRTEKEIEGFSKTYDHGEYRTLNKKNW